MPKVYFASDHAGFALKNALVEYIRTLGYNVEDMGAFALNPEDDYPDFITLCARAVASDATARGIIIGKSGEGEAMCANRVAGVRAAVFYGPPSHKASDGRGGSLEIIQLAREHNNANILSLGAQFITIEEAQDTVKQFLETPFSDSPCHARRLAKF